MVGDGGQLRATVELTVQTSSSRRTRALNANPNDLCNPTPAHQHDRHTLDTLSLSLFSRVARVSSFFPFGNANDGRLRVIAPDGPFPPPVPSLSPGRHTERGAMDFDLEMDADSPTTSHPQPLRPPEPSRGPSSASYPPASSHPPQAALGPSSSASSSTSAPTQSPQPSLRFPSSFADFKLPTSPIVANSQAQATFAYHPPPNNDGGPSSSSSVFATGLAHGAQVSVNGGPGAMDLAAKRARRGSLLSLNNHYRAGGQDEQRPTSPLAAAPSTSSFTFGIPSSTSNSSTFSSTSTARPSTPPANGHWGSSLAREGRTHSAQSSSSMMISPPASHKVLSRPTSPMATLNPPSFPPSFREVMSSPKIGSHRLESGRLGASGSGSAGEREQGQNEEQMDMGDRDRITSRPITRTRNLKVRSSDSLYNVSPSI